MLQFPIAVTNCEPTELFLWQIAPPEVISQLQDKCDIETCRSFKVI